MARELIVNPYKNINWDNVTRRIGDFHQHSTESDGKKHPAILYDEMAEQDRDIAVITDHDSYRVNFGKYPKVLAVPTGDNPDGKYINTFPPSEYEGDLYYDPLSNKNYTNLARQGSLGEFDRDINGVMQNGLLAIEGCEVTAAGSTNGTHDFVSLLNTYSGLPRERTTFEALQNVKDINGISIMAHPWRYDFTPRWYKDVIKKYSPSCIAIELDKYSLDFWDKIITLDLDTQPIWGFGNTDSHDEVSHYRYNIVFMENLTENELRQRLVAGNFYSCYGSKNAPVITKIETNEVTKKINITTEDPKNVVRWVSCGKVIHTGNELNYSKTKGISRYVRAEVVNSAGIKALTNPFYFNRFVEPKFN